MGTIRSRAAPSDRNVVEPGVVRPQSQSEVQGGTSERSQFVVRTDQSSGLTDIEKVACLVSGVTLAASGLFAALSVRVDPRYPDFVVGHLAWQADTKLQDLLAGPATIAAGLLGLILSLGELTRQKKQHGEEHARELSEQLIWWSMPAITTLLGSVLGLSLDERLLFFSATALVFIIIVCAGCRRGTTRISPQIVGLWALGVVLVGLVPLEVALVVGRISERSGDELSQHATTALYFLGVFGAFVGTVLAFNAPRALARSLPVLLLLGGLGLPLLFVSLVPATLLPSNGDPTKYETTFWLYALAIGLVVAGVSDVGRRFVRYLRDGNVRAMLSPIALYALLVGLKLSTTQIPIISSDDYHFGEALLGWWSYLQGTVPYVGYLPAHGLVDDDLSGLVATVLFDGSAGSLAEAGRFTTAILGLATFASLYRFSGSLGLAFVSTLFLGGRLASYFVTIFICLWCSPSLLAAPSVWLAVWLLTIPIVVLGVPAQGLLLVTASSLLALHAAWRCYVARDSRAWRSAGIAVGLWAIVAVVCPVVPMLHAALRYVLENGPVNETGYGIPWLDSWSAFSSKSRPILEAIRMSWLVIPVTCWMLLYRSAGKWLEPGNRFGPAAVVLVFTVLMIPYSMGRIDAEALSRPGLTAIFGWTILVPIASWTLVREQGRMALSLVVVCAGAILHFTPSSAGGLLSASASQVSTPPLVQTSGGALSNIGHAAMNFEHWSRLKSLSEVLNRYLSKNAPYLDLTSRNAHYFYLGRKPVVSVTAPYNMVPLAQQKREVETLRANLPRLALLEAANINHDGGGLALRTPYLFRFVLDNYTPVRERGFIVGHAKSHDATAGAPKTLLRAQIRDFSDENWDRGIHRREAAVVIDDAELVALIQPGDQVLVGNGQARNVERVWPAGSAVWFEGPPLQPAMAEVLRTLTFGVASGALADYRSGLFQRAFAQHDLFKIPLAWGRSEKTLEARMLRVLKLDDPSSPTSQAAERGRSNVGTTPSAVSFDLAERGISGRDAGLLAFDFACENAQAESRMRVFWWGDHHTQPFEASSLTFIGANGRLIVPLDSSPRWLMLEQVRGIRLEIGSTGCGAVSVKNVGLFQRRF